MAAHHPRIDRATLSRVLIEREQLASTAIGEGVAIPHGKLGAVGEIVACLGPRADRRRVRLDGRSADVSVLRARRARVVDRRAPEGARADQPRVQGPRVPPPAAGRAATPRRCTTWSPTRTPSTRWRAAITVGELRRARGARRHRGRAGSAGLARTVTVPRIQKPGLALTGWPEQLHADRVLVLGGTEIEYLADQRAGAHASASTTLLASDPACVVVCRGLAPPAELRAAAEARGVPLLVSLARDRGLHRGGDGVDGRPARAVDRAARRADGRARHRRADGRQERHRQERDRARSRRARPPAGRRRRDP